MLLDWYFVRKYTKKKIPLKLLRTFETFSYIWLKMVQKGSTSSSFRLLSNDVFKYMFSGTSKKNAVSVIMQALYATPLQDMYLLPDT